MTRALLRSRRQHRRDQHGAKASLAHQGRAARAARAAGARRHARDLRRAGRRSGGDRLGSDRARSHRRSPTPAPSSRAIGSTCRRPSTRALADPKNETPKPGDPVFAGDRIQADRAAGRCLPRRRGRRSRGRLRARPARRPHRGRGPRGRGRARHAARWLADAGPPRRHPVRRRADGDDPRPGPGRPQPGIRPGAGAWRSRARPASRRWPATPTAPTAARAPRTIRPAPSIDDSTLSRARALGLDPAAFLSDNDSTGFFTRLGDLVETGPTCTNVNDFRAIVVDRP